MRLFRRRRGPEDDVPQDPAVAGARERGGVPDQDKPDQASTTGTTPDGDYVGRIAGEDTGGACEQPGAERRAEVAENADRHEH